jgi:hypothetical protein
LAVGSNPTRGAKHPSKALKNRDFRGCAIATPPFNPPLEKSGKIALAPSKRKGAPLNDAPLLVWITRPANAGGVSPDRAEFIILARIIIL